MWRMLILFADRRIDVKWETPFFARDIALTWSESGICITSFLPSHGIR